MSVNTGADDYITKPFSMYILIAKINALLRRTYSYGDEIFDLLKCKLEELLNKKEHNL